MASASPLPLALAFCAGSMLTVLVWSLGDQGGAASPAPTDQSEVLAELREIRSGIERMGREQALNSLPSLPSVPSSAAAGSGRSPDLSPVLISLDQTMKRLESHLQAGNGGTAGIEQARNVRRTADWGALLPIAQAMSRDEDQAKRAVRFLTPRELLERFGPPDEVYSSKESVSWYYGRTASNQGDEATVSEITFRIQDGYVINAWGSDDATEELLEGND